MPKSNMPSDDATEALKKMFPKSTLEERMDEEPPMGMLPNGELNVVSEDYDDGKWIMGENK